MTERDESIQIWQVIKVRIVFCLTLIQSKFYPDPDIRPVNESNLTRGECVHDVQSRG